MRKLLTGVFFLFASSLLFATSTLNFNLKDMSTVAINGSARVNFQLQNCGGNVARVVGVGIVSPSKDYLPDSSGHVGGTIYSNAEIDCGGQANTWYTVTYFLNGLSQYSNDYIIANNTTWDWSTAIPILSFPTNTPPDAPTTYLRKDGANGPVTGTLGVNNLVTKQPFVNIQFYGADPSNTADSTTAIQNAANFALSNCYPLYIPTGSYKMTTSINLTNGIGCKGFKVFGDGRVLSTLNCTLSAAFPCLDFTGTQQAHIQDFHILGGSAGAQTAGILIARDSVSITGDESDIHHVLLEGKFAKADLAWVNADLNRIYSSDLYNSAGPVIASGSSDFLGVGSAYRSFNNGGGNTKNSIGPGVTLNPSADAGVRFDTGASINIYDTFYSQAGTSSAFVRTSGTGGMNVYLTDCRQEHPGSASPAYIIDLSTTGSTGGRIVGGEYDVAGGPFILTAVGRNVSGYDIFFPTSTPGLQLVDGGGSLFASHVRMTNGQFLLTNIGASSNTNVIQQTGGSAQNIPGANVYLAGNTLITPFAVRMGMNTSLFNEGLNSANNRGIITARNAANTNDLMFIRLDTSDVWEIGDAAPNLRMIPAVNGINWGDPNNGGNRWNVYANKLRVGSTNASDVNAILTFANNPGSQNIPAQRCVDNPVTVTGAAVGGVAHVSPTYTIEANLDTGTAWVSAANTVMYRICNVTAAIITTASGASYSGSVQQ